MMVRQVKSLNIVWTDKNSSNIYRAYDLHRFSEGKNKSPSKYVNFAAIQKISIAAITVIFVSEKN